MSQLKNLYTHLVANRIASISEWLDRYKKLLRDVETVRKALADSKDIKDDSVYSNGIFGTDSDTWPKFANRLLRARNGVSSRGQSVLSSANFQQFIQDKDFVYALSRLIEDPSRDNVTSFEKAWEKARQKYGGNANPLLINRTVAACTTDVSTTVNNAAFDTVYHWLIKEEILPQGQNGDTNWYDKNVQVIRKLRDLFQEELNRGETDEYLLNIFVWELFEYISNPLPSKSRWLNTELPVRAKPLLLNRMLVCCLIFGQPNTKTFSHVHFVMSASKWCSSILRMGTAGSTRS